MTASLQAPAILESGNPLQPFGHLDLRCALVGSTGLVDLLLFDEGVHVPVGEGDLVLVFLAEELFLGEGGLGEFGEGVAEAADASVGESGDLGWSPLFFGGAGRGGFVAWGTHGGTRIGSVVESLVVCS